MHLLLLAVALSTGRYSRQLTYSVYVVLKLSWQVQVDDMGNAFHVQPSTGHICRHQYLQAMHSCSAKKILTEQRTHEQPYAHKGKLCLQ